MNLERRTAALVCVRELTVAVEEEPDPFARIRRFRGAEFAGNRDPEQLLARVVDRVALELLNVLEARGRTIFRTPSESKQAEAA